MDHYGSRRESDRDQQNQSGRAGRHPEISILCGFVSVEGSMAREERQVTERPVVGGLVIAAILAI